MKCLYSRINVLVLPVIHEISSIYHLLPKFGFVSCLLGLAKDTVLTSVNSETWLFFPLQKQKLYLVIEIQTHKIPLIKRGKKT
jgi:hypothetical protein